MNNYPQILYWKWDSNIFIKDTLETKVNDILNRSNFDLIYVSFHWMERPFDDNELICTIEKCCELFHKAGRKFMLDIDIRNEGKSFFEKYPKSHAYFSKFIEIELNEYGFGEIFLEPITTMRWGNEKLTSPEYIINAWILESNDSSFFVKDSLLNVKSQVEMENFEDGMTKISIDVGKTNASKKAIIFPAYSHVVPDFYSPFLYEYFSYMFEKVEHIALDGIGTDEWGYSLTLLFDEQGAYIEHFPYSPNMSISYEEKYGTSLDEELIYLMYAPLNDNGTRVKVINNYIENYRNKMAENESWIYHKGKEVFGKDTFISAHPTWWGDAECTNLEVAYNGLDWWEVKRDFAQTDERVLIPIRLALAHKFGGKVWYNMFYNFGATTPDAHIEETWNNARYGGRTHQLGYECPNEGILEFCGEGILEQISEMEDEIAKLNEFQLSQPDSRVLILFGMESVTNWELAGLSYDCWRNYNPVMTNVFKFTKDLFDGGYLCDLIPSSEISNGSLVLNDDKISYGTQTYDAVIFISPQSIKLEVLEFVEKYYETNKNLILIGECSLFNDGTLAIEQFNSFSKKLKFKFESSPNFEDIVRILEHWQIQGNKFENGSIFQDGSAIFTAHGDKSKGNKLIVNCRIKVSVKYNPSINIIPSAVNSYH